MGRREGRAHRPRRRQVGGDVALKPIGVDLAGVLTLAQHAAGRDEAGDREGPRTDADGDVGDRVLHLIVEDPEVPLRHALTREPGLDAVQGLGLQGRVGLGDIVADPERAVQLVQGRRPEAGIGRRPHPGLARQALANADAARRRRARGVGRRGVQGQGAGGRIALAPHAVIGSPAVQPCACRQREVRFAVGPLDIRAADKGAAASRALTGEGAGHVAEELVGPPLGHARVAAQLPRPVAGLALPGGVEAIAAGRGRVLVVGRRRADAARRDGGRSVLQVAPARPRLHAPGVACQRHGQRAAGGVGPRADQAGITLLLEGPGADRPAYAAEVALHPRGDRAVLQGGRCVGRARRRAPNRPIAVGARAAGGQQQVLGPEGSRRAPTVALAGLGREAGQAAAGRALAQGHHARQRAGAVGSRPRAAHDGGAGQALARQGGPDHPAAERIVLRRAIQRHQRSSRAGGRDGPKR